MSMIWTVPTSLLCHVLSHFSPVRLCATLRTVARQSPLSMGFSRQEYWSGSPCPPPGDLPNPGIKPASFTSPALAGGLFTTSATWEDSLVPYNLPIICGCLRRWFIIFFKTFYSRSFQPFIKILVSPLPKRDWDSHPIGILRPKNPLSFSQLQ